MSSMPVAQVQIAVLFVFPSQPRPWSLALWVRQATALPLGGGAVDGVVESLSRRRSPPAWLLASGSDGAWLWGAHLAGGFCGGPAGPFPAVRGGPATAVEPGVDLGGEEWTLWAVALSWATASLLSPM